MSTSSSLAPFAEPLWYTRGLSPYYNESHVKLRTALREYVDTHISPFCEEWENDGAVPVEVRNVFPNQLAQYLNGSPLGCPKVCTKWLHGCFNLPPCG